MKNGAVASAILLVSSSNSKNFTCRNKQRDDHGPQVVNVCCMVTEARSLGLEAPVRREQEVTVSREQMQFSVINIFQTIRELLFLCLTVSS